MGPIPPLPRPETDGTVVLTSEQLGQLLLLLTELRMYVQRCSAE